MALLELEHVRKRGGRGAHAGPLLDDVSLSLDEGELVAIWGMRRSGRSTLLRLAAGLETPDSGTVRFCGHDLSSADGDATRGAIAYCRRTFRPSEGRTVVEHLVRAQLARGVAQTLAYERTQQALKRVGADHCATLDPTGLDGSEAVRVAIGRALGFQPALVIVDEPVIGVDLLERDQVLDLLHSLASDGVAILMSAGETTELAGAHRALWLSDGELRGAIEPRGAEVLPLRRASA